MYVVPDSYLYVSPLYGGLKLTLCEAADRLRPIITIINV